ncbi:MAG: FAD-dependent monooxygenase [Actinobacteria bacterium]|nr:MAG: FAD-dependent monooxygenase [Actinomycetota bacterium]
MNSGMTANTDVAIVGGGSAGASLASALARGGLGVTVLEATTEFPDRVRGESMQAWGVAEARELGAEAVLLAAGAHVAQQWNPYAAGHGELPPLPMDMMVPGIPGSLNLRHPDACQALLDDAAARGATVLRGVAHIELTRDGASSTVAYDVDGQGQALQTSLVVGADGRNSTVRKQVGITLEHQEATSHIAGLLVDDLNGVPAEFDAVVSDSDRFTLLFHQGNGRARAYLCVGDSAQKAFAGPEGTRRFLERWNDSAYPWGKDVAAGTPAGPCSTYPGDDTWTAQPFADGVLLIGDAAGHNDPIIGQGLSIAMRDARTARDLVLGGARTAEAFAPYGAERMQRMERLRLIADVLAAVQAEDADNRPARHAYFLEKMGSLDPELFPLLIAGFAGPETMPEESVKLPWVERIRAA